MATSIATTLEFNSLDISTPVHGPVIDNVRVVAGSHIAGDANGDGFIDDGDLSRVLANWGKNTDWAHGNFNGDSIVNDDDLSFLLANWTGPPIGGAVPEPATLGLLAMGSVVLARRRRPRKLIHRPAGRLPRSGRQS